MHQSFQNRPIMPHYGTRFSNIEGLDSAWPGWQRNHGRCCWLSGTVAGTTWLARAGRAQPPSSPTLALYIQYTQYEGYGGRNDHMDLARRMAGTCTVSAQRTGPGHISSWGVSQGEWHQGSFKG